MNWSKLKTRLGSAVVLIALLLLVTFGPKILFTLAICAVGLVVLKEMMVTFAIGKKPALAIADYIFAILYMVTGIFAAGGNAFSVVTVFFFMTLLAILVICHKTVSLSDVTMSLLAVIYGVVLILHLAFLRNLDHGIALVFLAFVGAFIPDTMAYFAGNFFGKRKLIEAISPNKTVEGAIGGVVGGVVGFLVYGLVLFALGYVINIVSLLVLGAICSVVAQIGDLAASALKRAYGAKDFSSLIPGHGGLLDRIDSLLFVTPIVYYFISLFPVIV